MYTRPVETDRQPAGPAQQRRRGRHRRRRTGEVAAVHFVPAVPATIGVAPSSMSSDGRVVEADVVAVRQGSVFHLGGARAPPRAARPSRWTGTGLTWGSGRPRRPTPSTAPAARGASVGFGSRCPGSRWRARPGLPSGQLATSARSTPVRSVVGERHRAGRLTRTQRQRPVPRRRLRRRRRGRTPVVGQAAAVEPGPIEAGARQRGSRQHGTGEVGAGEGGLVERRVGQVAGHAHGLVEVGAGEVAPVRSNPPLSAASAASTAPVKSTSPMSVASSNACPLP